jgi:photosystem II stability/assembly factor-like uncharacterized protein
MQKLMSTFVLTMLGLLLITSTVPVCAQGYDTLRYIKLISPQDGWTATDHKVYLTADGGDHWKEVTPTTIKPMAKIAGAFFLNASSAWVLYSDYDNEKDHSIYMVAYTTDFGNSWSYSTLSQPKGQNAEISGAAHVYFIDQQHGWINLSVGTGLAFHRGAVIATTDGGKNWRWTPSNVLSRGEIKFTTLKDGWVLSDEFQLYVTHDAATSWQEVKLKAPPELKLNDPEPGYTMPVWKDSTHGLLTAAFSSDAGTKVLQYKTDDGGSSWTFYRVPSSIDGVSCSVGSSLIFASLSGDHKNVVTSKVPLDGTSEQAVVKSFFVGNVPNLGDVREISFADEKNGWINASRLLATHDGGASWKEVTPKQTHVAHLKVEDLRPLGSRSRPDSGAPVASAVNMRLGFDKQLVFDPGCPMHCSVQTSIGYMQTWWNESPYFVTSLYLPGSGANQRVDHDLAGTNGPTWVSAVQQQGWALIPIWVGKQSPCACANANGVYGVTCTPFADLISTTSPDADGTAEANSASTAAAAIGVGSTIVYKDLENYDPTVVLPNGATCGSVVDTFLSYWTSTIHGDGNLSGAYGSPTDGTNWHTSTSPLPDDVWMAKYDNAATIWGLNYGLLNQYWPNHQRIKQYVGNTPETFGGTPSFSVDVDIMHATLAGLSASKTYYVGQIQENSTYKWLAANDVGQVTGYYSYNVGTNYYQGGALFQNGTTTQFLCNGEPETLSYAINNKNIAGVWTDGTQSNPHDHGFVYNISNQTCQTLDYTLGTWGTEAFGIADDNAVSGIGYSEDANHQTNCLYPFFYQSGTFAAINPPGSTPCQTIVYGLNGDDQVLGNAVISGADYSFTYQHGVYTILPVGVSGGPNNNGEFLNSTGVGESIFDENTGNTTFIQTSGGIQYGFAMGLNDLIWLPGYDPTTGMYAIMYRQ